MADLSNTHAKIEHNGLYLRKLCFYKLSKNAKKCEKNENIAFFSRIPNLFIFQYS